MFWLNWIEFRQDVKTSELTMLPQTPNKMHKSTIKSLITTHRAWYIFAHSRLQKAKSRSNHSIDERKPVRTLLMKAQRFEKQLVWSLDLYRDTHFLPPLSLTPRTRSNFTMIWLFGIAFPDSYSWMTCGFSLICCHKSRRQTFSPSPLCCELSKYMGWSRASQINYCT